MFQRILTDKERRQAKKYLEDDGARNSIVRSLVSRGKKHLPILEADLAVLKQLVETYETQKTKGKA
jgi:hypothetical protein